MWEILDNFLFALKTIGSAEEKKSIGYSKFISEKLY